jgi:hypothetical protein
MTAIVLPTGDFLTGGFAWDDLLATPAVLGSDPTATGRLTVSFRPGDRAAGRFDTIAFAPFARPPTALPVADPAAAVLPVAVLVPAFFEAAARETDDGRFGAVFPPDAARVADFFTAIFVATSPLVPAVRPRADPARAAACRFRAATLARPRPDLPRAVFVFAGRVGSAFVRPLTTALDRPATARAGFAVNDLAPPDFRRTAFTAPFIACPAFRAFAAAVGRRVGLLRWVDAMGSTLVTVEAR